MPSIRTLAATALLAAGAISQAALAADPLPSFKGDPKETSVSGLSSGAFMAVQYQVAYSATVKGSGVIAGGPYYCAADSMLNTSICMGQVPFVPPNPAPMVSAAQKFAAQGSIDPLSNLANSHIYVFSGTADTIVRQPAVDSTVSFFQQAGVPAANLQYVNTMPAGHALITPTYGNDCPANAAPYISHCQVKGIGYDQAGALLQHIYGQLNPPATTTMGQIVAFNQREFADASTGMADVAYVYVPNSCAQGATCKVHVAIHGCQQSAAVVGNDFYADTGYNAWADTNNLLILYPQVNASSVPYNPQGCWDWFGYTGPNYALKSGVQPAAIKAMADRLVAKK